LFKKENIMATLEIRARQKEAQASTEQKVEEAADAQ
jgi:hypothetical protein